jgi:hypothetical protein
VEWWYSQPLEEGKKGLRRGSRMGESPKLLLLLLVVEALESVVQVV